MKKKSFQIILLVVTGVFIWILGWQHHSNSDFTHPDIRKNESIQARSELLNLQKAIEHYLYQIRQNPDRIHVHVHLARAYMQQGRITGRHHEYLSLAQDALDRASKLEQDNMETIATQASLFLSLHHFEKARVLSEKALSQNDGDAFIWGVYSDALKELGLYKGAVEACDRMLSIRPDIRSYSRAAHLRELHGDQAGAKEAMRLAVNAGVIGLESHAWTAYQLGNLYLKEGKADTAKFIFEKILQTCPNYAFAFKGLAQVALANQQEEQVIQYLLSAYAQRPEHEFAADLASAYAEIGDVTRAEFMVQSVSEALAQHEKQGWNVNLEMADLYLTHGFNQREALRRAELEFNRRPKHLDVLRTYAWALLENGQPGQAEVLLAQVLRQNDKDTLARTILSRSLRLLGKSKEDEQPVVPIATSRSPG